MAHGLDEMFKEQVELREVSQPVSTEFDLDNVEATRPLHLSAYLLFFIFPAPFRPFRFAFRRARSIWACFSRFSRSAPRSGLFDGMLGAGGRGLGGSGRNPVSIAVASAGRFEQGVE